MRKEIEDFGNAMEDKMAFNDKHKGDSWKRMPLGALSFRLKREFNEWEVIDRAGRAQAEGIPDKDPMPYYINRCRAELVDIANMCMMLYNRLNSGGDKR